MEATDQQFTVQIRSPSLHETLTIDTHQNATIRELKLRILDIHPRKPAVNDQRIIFGGKVLNDGEVLKQILERTDFANIAPTLHLVVKPSLPFSGAGSSSSARFHHSAATESPSLSLASEPPSSFQPQTQAHTQAQAQTQTQTQTHTQTQTQTQTQTNGSGTTAPAQSLPPHPSMLPGGYQVVALNGQYYLAPVLVPTYDPSLLQHYQQQQQQQQNYGAQGIAGTGAAVPPPAPAVRPRENNVQRATSIWLALKLIFVLFILCQDASLERILFFHAIAFIFFLYQTGRLRFIVRQIRVEDLNGAPRRQHQAPPPPAPQAEPTARAPPRLDEQQDFSTGMDANNGNGDSSLRQRQVREDQREQQQPQQQSPAPIQPQTLLNTLKRGAYTFIASLWPNYGNDARIAQALDNGQQNAWEGF
ncbi:hypothetical protein BX666DRAFT_2025726 [Dichotomocladium elegans]|nr:hypothetical protein BX666DRAFT_2025726 [Dichotomocladium elegans]